MAELRRAGFHGELDQLDAAAVEAHDRGLPPDVRFKVLRDPSGAVVAEWQEGRCGRPLNPTNSSGSLLPRARLG